MDASNAPACLLDTVQAAGEDYEWYPTTARMIDAVARHIPTDHCGSILDIGAGDGRVLTQLAARFERSPELYAIEKSTVLIQAQPDNIVPVGAEFHEQNLACIELDYIFCNPPYSQFEAWAVQIIGTGYARKAFLVIPRRWKDSAAIRDALKRRGASSRVIHSDDFLDADRRARAVVDVVEISYPLKSDYSEAPTDPFDIWFDQNISTFDPEEDEPDEYCDDRELARKYQNANIREMVDAYNEEYARLETNYRAIFALDYAILRELGIKKDAVREGIKTKMAGLKSKYWHILFERLDAITTRLCTETKKHFLEKLTGRAAVAFTASNAYAIVLWAVKNANRYYDEQLIALFRGLSNAESVLNYKSNQRTWEKGNWRFSQADYSHYALDYRFVVPEYSAIDRQDGGYAGWEYESGLHRRCHELLDDIIAVLSNLGYDFFMVASRDRGWVAGQWQNFCSSGTHETLFQVKAHLNGNLHFRFMPDAIRRLNVEAGRLLGWIHNTADVVRELGYSEAEATRHLGSNFCIAPSNIPLLTAT